MVHYRVNSAVTIIFCCAILFCLACDSWRDKMKLAEANASRLRDNILTDKDVGSYFLDDDLRTTMDFELSLKIMHEAATDTAVLNSIIATVTKHADSCQPLFYWFDLAKQNRGLRVRLYSVFERELLEWATISFMRNGANVDWTVDRAHSKLKRMAGEKVWSFLQDRWDYYEKRDGDYLPSHDDIVLREAAERFNMTKEEALKQFTAVEYRRLGIKIKPSLPLKDQDTSVELVVERVAIDNGLLCVTLRNNTKWNGQLPTVNLTCNKYNKWGSTFSSDGYQVIWFEDLGPGEVRTECSIRPQSPDFVELVAYINIDEMHKSQLKSAVQRANDPGETVIPVLITDKIEIRR